MSGLPSSLLPVPESREDVLSAFLPKTKQNTKRVLPNIDIETDAECNTVYDTAVSLNGEEADATTAECIVAKNRPGEVGKVGLGWDGAHTRFSNLDVTHEF